VLNEPEILIEKRRPFSDWSMYHSWRKRGQTAIAAHNSSTIGSGKKSEGNTQALKGKCNDGRLGTETLEYSYENPMDG
jgi:hypothetical protein